VTRVVVTYSPRTPKDQRLAVIYAGPLHDLIPIPVGRPIELGLDIIRCLRRAYVTTFTLRDGEPVRTRAYRVYHVRSCIRPKARA
jgi:hypothetical protein